MKGGQQRSLFSEDELKPLTLSRRERIEARLAKERPYRRTLFDLIVKMLQNEGEVPRSGI